MENQARNVIRPRVIVAPTGARRGKTDHPQLPVNIAEISECAKQCFAAGADEIHLHVRDDQGLHSLDVGLYREAIQAIAVAAPGMAVQVTTEAAGRFTVDVQLTVVEKLRPVAASVSVREALREPELAARLYSAARECGTNLQHILYDSHDVMLLTKSMEDGIVPPDMRAVLLVLGRYSPQLDARPEELAPFLDDLGPSFPDWTVCAFGQNEHAVLMAAAARGGNLRVGFENNLCRPDGTFARDNAENVARIISAISAIAPARAQERSTS